jgi:hypothetical protein
MTALEEVRPVLAAFRTDPPRGGGRTRENFAVLARAGADDLDVARLAEAHLDAATILAELDGPAPAPGSCWGVWAAEPPGAEVRAEPVADAGWRLSGRKPFCSGAAGPCTHALVTARADDGRRLFAVDLAAPGITVSTGEWQATGMRGSAAATVDLDTAPGAAVGAPEVYLERPGFWHGAVAVAAAWFGGAVGVAAPLRRAGRDGRLDAHGHAHLGAVDAALAAARSVLRDAAGVIDGAPHEPAPVARRRALQVRAVVEAAVDSALRRTGRALGPGPLVRDAEHARRVADLEIYVRQSHAERDLATLGELAGELGDVDRDPLS